MSTWQRAELVTPGRVVTDTTGVGDIIRETMSRRNISQNAVGYRAGVSTATISRIVNGQTGVDFQTVVNIVEGLGGTVEVRLPGGDR